jgi:hypothetical protein
MDERPIITNEEKGKAVLKLLSTLFVLEGISVAIFLILPIFIMGMDNFANGMPLTVLPFMIVSSVSFAYYFIHLKKINES